MDSPGATQYQAPPFLTETVCGTPRYFHIECWLIAQGMTNDVELGLRQPFIRSARSSRRTMPNLNNIQPTTMGFSSGTLCSIIFFAVILISQLQSRWLNRHRQLSRMPPGPRGLPIIGNLHQVTADYQERTFARWAKNYGKSQANSQLRVVDY